MTPVTLVLHGALADLVEGGRFRVFARSAVEAVRALFCQLPRDLDPRRVLVVGREDTKGLVEDPLREDEELHLVPQFAGGKSGGAFVQIALGAALVGASIAFPGMGAVAAGIAFNLGASLMVGGVLGLLAPAPGRVKTRDNEKSDNAYLGAPGNTTAIGTRIQIICGRVRVYPHILSFNIDAKDVA